MANWLRNYSTHNPIDSSLIKYSSSGTDSDSVKTKLDALQTAVTALQNQTYVIARRKKFQVYKKPGSTAAITADSVSGYTFLCWLSCSTSGWVGSVYVNDVTAARANIWVVANSNGSTDQTVLSDVYCTALYIKSNS